MENLTLLNTSFICPYMKINLEASCGLKSCYYYTDKVKSCCVWEYICSKNSISVVELSIILNRDKREIFNIINQAKTKITEEVVRRKISITNMSLKYCYSCGRAFNLKKEKDQYVCKENCKKNNTYTYIETLYKKPISHVLSVVCTLIKVGTIAKLFKTSNKTVKDMYTYIFGDDSLLARNRDLKESKFKKRGRRLKIRSPLPKTKTKSLTFSTIRKRLTILEEKLYD